MKGAFLKLLLHGQNSNNLLYKKITHKQKHFVSVVEPHAHLLTCHSIAARAKLDLTKLSLFVNAF
jgi:hypothetical protein